MSELIVTTINKESTSGIKLTVTDVNGDIIQQAAISSIIYTWTDSLGVVINGKENISVTPSNPIIIKIEPLDAFFVNATVPTVDRLLIIKLVYQDTILGTTTLVKEYKVVIDNNINTFV
jgi:hypothetical protein